MSNPMVIPNKRDVNFMEEAIPIKNKTVSVPSRKTARKERMAKENRLPVFNAFVLFVLIYLCHSDTLDLL